LKNNSKRFLNIDFKKLFADEKFRFFIFILFFLLMILILPSLLRSIKNDSFILFSQDSYYHLRVSDYVEKEGVYPSYDWFSFSGSDFNRFFVYESILFFISNIFNVPIFFVILYLPVIFGIMFFVILYIVLLKTVEEKNLIRIFVVLLITSPLFLYLFCVSNYCYIPAFILILGIYFYVSSNFYLKWVSYFLFLIIPVFGIVFLLITILFFLFLYQRNSDNISLFASIFLGAVFIILTIFCSFSFSLNTNFDFSRFNLLISDLGYVSGLSLFLVLLFIFGIVKKMEDRKRKQDVYFDLFAAFCLVLIFLFFSEMSIYFLNFIFVYYAAWGFIYIFEFNYSMNLFKVFTLFLIISCAVFAPVSYITSMSSFYPDKDAIDALNYLNYFENNDYAVLSTQKHGIMINAVSKHPNIIDDNSHYKPDYEKRLKEMDNIFYTRNVTLVNSFFNEYNIKYVFLDDRSKKEFWLHENQGFLFILKESAYFEKIYDKNGYTIYKYVFS
jgi:hypothetical protein